MSKTERITVSIKLTKPHRHAGRDYKPGAVLRLAEDKADWLKAEGVAEDAPAQAEFAATKAAAASTSKPKE